MVAALARDPSVRVPLSGIGGITTWRDAAEFFSLGATSVQLCTAVMHHGYRIIDDLIDGLTAYLRSKQMRRVSELRGAALPNFVEWGELDLNQHRVASIDPALCIGCQVCVTACHDGAHQCIFTGPHDRQRPPHAHTPGLAKAPVPFVHGAIAKERVPWVDEPECVGCNLCQIVCPVPGCITMVDSRKGPVDTWNDRLRDGRDRITSGGIHDHPDPTAAASAAGVPSP